MSNSIKDYRQRTIALMEEDNRDYLEKMSLWWAACNYKDITPEKFFFLVGDFYKKDCLAASSKYRKLRKNARQLLETDPLMALVADTPASAPSTNSYLTVEETVNGSVKLKESTK